MRILFVSDLYPINVDNTIPKIVEDFCLGFKKIGYEVCVLRGNFLFNTYLRHHKVYKNGIYHRNGIKIYNKNFLLPFLNSSIDFLEEKFDLIISHMPSGHIYSSLLNQKLNLPHIAILHQSDYKVLKDKKYSFYFKNRLQKALHSSTLIGARNKFLKEKLNARFILPSFIDREKIVQFHKIQDKNKLKIITLSKLIKRKNIDLVINALSQVDFDFEYSIYGEGKEKNNLDKIIKNKNLQNKVKIYPFIEHKKVYSKLDNNDVFILPSVDETFGISYLEAMSRGLITIGVKNTGIDGVIEDNKNGYLIEPNIQNIVEILNKIKYENQQDIIKNTLLYIKNYTEEEIMNKYDDVIKKIYENRYF